jgi:O-antigen/teichoic acid export membrane protein
VLANVIRQLCAPYSTIVVATARQGVATASGVVEAMVNLAASVWLAMHYGAMGVAAGTLIGSAAGVAMHFGVSMHYTRNIAVSRTKLFLRGIFLPAAMAIPALLLLQRWMYAGPPAIGPGLWMLSACATVLIAWFVSVNSEDRALLNRLAHRRGSSI